MLIADLLECCARYSSNESVAIVMASLAASLVEVATASALTAQARAKGDTVRNQLKTLLTVTLTDYDHRMGLKS